MNHLWLSQFICNNILIAIFIIFSDSYNLRKVRKQMILNPFSSKLTLEEHINELKSNKKQKSASNLEQLNPFKKNSILRDYNFFNRPVSCASANYLSSKPKSLSNHSSFYTHKKSCKSIKRPTLSKSLKSEALCQSFKRKKQAQIYKQYTNIFGYEELRYKVNQNQKNSQYFQKQKNGYEKISKGDKKNEVFRESLELYTERQSEKDGSSCQSCIKNPNSSNKNRFGGKNKKIMQTKKMLSWNIQIENKNIKSPNSSKQILLPQDEKTQLTHNRFTFGNIDHKQEQQGKQKKLRIRKQSSISNENFNADNVCQDFILEKSNDFKMSYNSNRDSLTLYQNISSNQQRNSYQSWMCDKQYNNLRYDSNFEGFKSQQLKQIHNNLEYSAKNKFKKCNNGHNNVKKIIYNDKEFQFIQI